MTGGWIVYGIVFLELITEDAYECILPGTTDKWTSCDRQKDICDRKLPKDKWRINYDTPRTYHNWVDPSELDLSCVEGSIIGLIGSAFFLGFAVSASFTPYLSDKYGRKKPYLTSLSLQTIAYVGIFFSTNLYFTIFGFFLVGLSSGGRCAIGTNYMNEYLPIKN